MDILYNICYDSEQNRDFGAEFHNQKLIISLKSLNSQNLISNPELIIKYPPTVTNEY